MHRIICFLGIMFATANAIAAECKISKYKPYDNQNIHAGVGNVIPGANLANVPIYTTIERCAQILIQCSGYGSTLVDPENLTAHFSDGKSKRAKETFETFRLHGGESRVVNACFGNSKAPIVNIEGWF